MNIKLSEYIDKECKRKRITKKEFAAKSQLSESYLRNLRKGKYETITIDTLKSIAKGLDISLRNLLENVDEIDVIYDFLLTENDSIQLLDQLEPFIKKCGIETKEMNNSQIFELANYIMLTIKMNSRRF